MSGFEIIHVSTSHPQLEELFQQAVTVFCRERHPVGPTPFFSQLVSPRLYSSLPSDRSAAPFDPNDAHPSRTTEGLAERWRQALFGNPSGSAGNPGCFWLARQKTSSASHDSTKLLGVLLGVPCQVVSHIGCLSGHWGVDLYVPESARGQGVGEALLTAWRDHSPLALGLGITDSAFRLEQKLGWTVVPLPPPLRFPLSASGHAWLLAQQLRVALTASEVSRGRVQAGAQALRTTLQAGLMKRLSTAPHLKGGRLEIAGRRSQPLVPATAEVLARTYGLTRPVLGFHLERSAAALSFMYPSHLGFRWLTLPDEGGCVVLRPELRGGILRWWLHELYWRPQEPGSLQRLVEALLEQARREQVDVLGMRCTEPRLRQALESLGFIGVGAPERFIVHQKEGSQEAVQPEAVPSGETLSGDRQPQALPPGPGSQTLPRLASGPWHLTLGDSGNRASWRVPA